MNPRSFRHDGFISQELALSIVNYLCLTPRHDPYNCSLDSNCESRWKKMIGKPYAGKLHVRFDEGELEIGGISYYASSLLYPAACCSCGISLV
jgi:hypothetical protein